MNLLLTQQRSDGSIADHRVRYSETGELDGGETSALLVRTGLGEVGVKKTTLLVEGGDDAERRSVALYG